MSATPPDSTLPWAPEDLPAPIEQLAGFGYVVVEEIVGSLALLRRWPWPAVDQCGRLVWLGDSELDSHAATVAVELLRAQCYSPNRLRRSPRCGDTFAVPGSAGPGWQAEGEVSDVRQLLSGSFYDISADAREAARLAYHAALGAVPTAESVDEGSLAEQEKTLRSRTSRPLRALRVAAPPRSR